MRAVFDVFDMDRDGFITVEEVFQVLESMRFLPSPDSIDDIFRQVDLDGCVLTLSSLSRCAVTLMLLKFQCRRPGHNGCLGTSRQWRSEPESGIKLTAF